MFDVFHGTAPTYLTDICSRCSDSRLRSSARGNLLGVRRTLQGHASLTVRSELLDLPPGTRFQLTSGTFVHTQRSADNLKLSLLVHCVPD